MARVLLLKNPPMYGSDVIDLQRILNGLNYNAGEEDGYFGTTTEKAVKSFQGDYGLVVDGEVGTYTWSKLKSEVKAIQSQLNKVGFNCGTPDGYFGTGTKRAVKNFQTSKGLTSNGIVDYITRQKLFESQTAPLENYYESRNETEINTLYNSTIKSAARSVVADALEQGIDILITCGFRSLEEQKKLYEDPNVYAAAPGKSYHNYGLAIDFVPVDENGNCLWSDLSAFNKVGSIGKNNGFEWGGDWVKKDRPHLQMPFGLTITQLLNGQRP
ncbi:peptidoglycan-binding protein [Vallitalea pronyensis]|uniref:Peptidoglycan-binding protein n=1 Tax=Vallitalea pronyensis TaxID=1348613 RepID=A0A8J8MNL5_9FIRM|nr:peptidoglycan-binding protein [Vallitalea pronyensis]QUI24500.1 peptidoglycan-binding protein [Vallitalea pronyensis]QUI24503.1 peptidoglycan-binding protein [Vallitalea pronyensis]